MEDRQLLERTTPDIKREVARIAEEFRAGFEHVALIDRPAAAMIGSAGVGDKHPASAAARAVGRLFAERDWAVITGGGGGGGVMEAPATAAPRRAAGYRWASTSSCPTSSRRIPCGCQNPVTVGFAGESCRLCRVPSARGR